MLSSVLNSQSAIKKLQIPPLEKKKRKIGFDQEKEASC